MNAECRAGPRLGGVRLRAERRSRSRRRDRTVSSIPRWVPPSSRAGYDRDFEDLDEHAESRPRPRSSPGRWQSVRLTGRLLARPRDVRLDLNGVVKALAVDDALTCIAGTGFVSAGGDLATRGPVERRVAGRRRRAGAGRRRRDERQRPSPLDARRCRAASPDRPAHRLAVSIAVDAGHGRRSVMPRGRRLREGGVPARRRRAGLARLARAAGALRVA